MHPVTGTIHAARRPLAKKPNYGFEKRQKELAKKQKRDEKRQRKLENAAEQPSESPAPPNPGPTIPRQ